jgi:hypothetical protein
MDDTLSSERNRRGDRFTATVVDPEAGYDLPAGTRVEGVVSGVTRAREDRPGMLDVGFRSLRLPSGQTYQIDGSPISLDSKNVRRTSDGRLIARKKSDNSKFIAYGAGAGLIIGSLLGENITGALLGAAAGYLYGQQQRKRADGREVVVREGTEFGVRLDERIALAPTWDDRYRERVGAYRTGAQDDRYRYDDRYRGDVYRYGRDDVRVLVNGRAVQFGSARPIRTSNDRLLVPLAPVLDAAGIRYRYNSRLREVTVDDSRDVDVRDGSAFMFVGGRREQLSAPARIISGTFYVPADFFDRGVGLRVNWNDDQGELALES